MTVLAVYCGSSSGNDPAYRDQAALLGRILAKRGIRIIYGGGRVGLMGILANAALEAGGEVTGVIPGFLQIKEVAHQELTEMVRVESMHERKALIERRCDGAIALPGGFGTMDEMFEMLTWGQLGLHQKPVGLLNVNRFFDPLLQMVDQMVTEGFLRTDYRTQLLTSDDIESLLDQMSGYQPPTVEKWIGLDQY
ncbi:MAG: LOG family protein [Bacteroidales bacterium]